MIIKLAILDSDQEYLYRLSSAFQSRYADKVEVYTFTDVDKAMSKVRASQIDVLLASGVIKINTAEIPENCGFAYLVDSPDIESFNEQKAISRYQKTETLYNAVANIYADSNTHKITFGTNSSGLPVYAVASACGGVGTTAVAAAVAKQLALAGGRPLYLSLDAFENPEVFFSGAGQSHFGDVVYSVKSRKASLSLKLESAVKCDPSGVYFYSAAANALDVGELTDEDVRALFSSLAQTSFCDSVVADVRLSLDERMIWLLEHADHVVFVSDGSDVADSKTERTIQAVRSMEKHRGGRIMQKAALFYNQFSNKTAAQSRTELRVLGGVPRFAHLSTPQVILKLINDRSVLPITEFFSGGAPQ